MFLIATGAASVIWEINAPMFVGLFFIWQIFPLYCDIFQDGRKICLVYSGLQSPDFHIHRFGDVEN